MPLIRPKHSNGNSALIARMRVPAVVDKIIDDLTHLSVPIDTLTHDPNNARLHPEANILAVMESLSMYGQRTPLVVNARGNVVEKGNGTLLAAKNLGWTKAAVVWVDDDEKAAAGYGLTDNKSAELARWDFEVVGRLQRLLADTTHGEAGWTDEELSVLRIANDEPTAPGEFQEVGEDIETEHQCPRCKYRFSGGSIE